MSWSRQSVARIPDWLPLLSPTLTTVSWLKLPRFLLSLTFLTTQRMKRPLRTVARAPARMLTPTRLALPS